MFYFFFIFLKYYKPQGSDHGRPKSMMLYIYSINESEITTYRYNILYLSPNYIRYIIITISVCSQVLRNREPHPPSRFVQAVHVDYGRGHMDPGRFAGHAVGHVLTRVQRTHTHDEHDYGVLLPVPDVAGQRLRQRHGDVQSAGVLRSAVVRHRMFLLPDGPPSDGVHAQHAGRAAARRSVRPDQGPEEGGQDGAVVRHHIHGQLSAVPRFHGVVPLLSVLARSVRRVLARVPHRRLLPELHELVCEPGSAVLHQRRVP